MLWDESLESMKVVELYTPRKARKGPQRTSFPKKRSMARTKKKKSQKPKYSLKKADSHFSQFIRERDGKCLFPGCQVTDLAKLQNSHYIGRATKSTRYDPENCISLCWFHHFKSKEYGWEYQKQTAEKHGWDGQYTLFMKSWLGENKYYALMERAKITVSQAEAVRLYFERGIPM